MTIGEPDSCSHSLSDRIPFAAGKQGSSVEVEDGPARRTSTVEAEPSPSDLHAFAHRDALVASAMLSSPHLGSALLQSPVQTDEATTKQSFFEAILFQQAAGSLTVDAPSRAHAPA